jgi:hypothetical protein
MTTGVRCCVLSVGQWSTSECIRSRTASEGAAASDPRCATWCGEVILDDLLAEVVVSEVHIII